MIVSGGENIAASEVEAALRMHPDVADCAVVGLPEPHWGERLVACIEPRLGSAPEAGQLERWARDRLAGYKVPRQYRFDLTLPRTASGKVQRRTLRDQLRELEQP